MAGAGKKYGDDWHYAHFWDPRLVVAGSDMPSYSSDFMMVQLSVSNQSYPTPSGEPVLGFASNPFFKKFFTLNTNKSIYFYVSDVRGASLPKGLKVFFSQISQPEATQAQGSKIDGVPVAWLPRRLRGKVMPGDQVTLIVPKSRVQRLVATVQSFPKFGEGEWLEDPGLPEDHSDATLGKRIYESKCSVCHGENGDGEGPASIFLFPKPRDFRSGEYKFKTTLRDEPPTDPDLFRTITFGMRGTSMPAWRPLPRKERWDLIAYLKTLAVDRQTGKNAFLRKPPKDILTLQEPQLDPRTLDFRAQTGRELYFSKGKCNDCHGPGGASRDQLPHGDGPSAAFLVDDWGYPIHPADLAGGTFKRGNSSKEVYITLTTGLMGTPMPSYQDNLTDEERWDIAFYVAQLNRKGEGR